MTRYNIQNIDNPGFANPNRFTKSEDGVDKTITLTPDFGAASNPTAVPFTGEVTRNIEKALSSLSSTSDWNNYDLTNYTPTGANGKMTFNDIKIILETDIGDSGVITFDIERHPNKWHSSMADRFLKYTKSAGWVFVECFWSQNYARLLAANTDSRLNNVITANHLKRCGDWELLDGRTAIPGNGTVSTFNEQSSNFSDFYSIDNVGSIIEYKLGSLAGGSVGRNSAGNWAAMSLRGQNTGDGIRFVNCDQFDLGNGSSSASSFNYVYGKRIINSGESIAPKVKQPLRNARPAPPKPPRNPKKNK